MAFGFILGYLFKISADKTAETMSSVPVGDSQIFRYFHIRRERERERERERKREYECVILRSSLVASCVARERERERE